MCRTVRKKTPGRLITLTGVMVDKLVTKLRLIQAVAVSENQQFQPI
jgi:hypothetical protein